MTQYEFELKQIPNQSFTTTINDIDMEITIKLGGEENNSVMYFDLRAGGEYICPAVPCVANKGLLPYPYMVSLAGGNFFFITDNDEYPNYIAFGNTQKFYFVTIDEITAANE